MLELTGLTALVAAFVAVLSGQLPPAPIRDAELAAADSRRGDWLTYGRTYYEQRFSPLDAINETTVSRLALAWSMDTRSEATLKDTAGRSTAGHCIHRRLGASSTPSTSARQGAVEVRPQPRKVHPEKDALAFLLRCGQPRRGLCDGRVYRRRARRPPDRARRQDRQAAVVERRPPIDPTALHITGAPRIFNGKVIIGNGGADYRRARLCHRLRRGDRQAGLALLHRARRARAEQGRSGDGEGAPRPGAANSGRPAPAAPCGTA